jgi:hypothetical protein
MALSDLAVYSEYTYLAMTEVLRQQVDLFNAASGGVITLASSAHQGDFSDSVFFKKIDGLIRRRNAYGTGSIAQKNMQQLVDTMVKVAAGTAEIRLDPGQFKWIQMNPETAGAALGQQLAIDVMADMLNTGLAAWYAAHIQVTANLLTITGRTTPADKLNFSAQVEASALLGDGSGGQVTAWIMHSKPMYDLLGSSIANNERLFTYDTVNVTRDPLGRLMIMTDSPALVDASGTPIYHTLGMTPGSLAIGQNNDYTAAEQTITGQENLVRTFQAEWSYELGVKGFSWDKANGGKSPTDAALFTSSNWDKYATSNKDIGGVIINSH